MKRNSARHRIVTALLMLYYILSMCGFNVHHDTVCGRTYLTLLVRGTGCSEIHPDHGCGGHLTGHLSEQLSEHISGGCGHHGCCSHASPERESHSGEEGISESHCNHCINEAGRADDSADLRSWTKGFHGAVSLSGQNLVHNPYHCLRTLAASSKEPGRQRGIPLSMLCVSRT